MVCPYLPTGRVTCDDTAQEYIMRLILHAGLPPCLRYSCGILSFYLHYHPVPLAVGVVSENTYCRRGNGGNAVGPEKEGVRKDRIFPLGGGELWRRKFDLCTYQTWLKGVGGVKNDVFKFFSPFNRRNYWLY